MSVNKKVISFGSFLGYLKKDEFNDPQLLKEIDNVLSKMNSTQMGIFATAVSIGKASIIQSYTLNPVFETKVTQEDKVLLMGKNSYQAYFNQVLVSRPTPMQACSVYGLSQAEDKFKYVVNDGSLQLSAKDHNLELDQLSAYISEYSQSNSKNMEFESKPQVSWVTKALNLGDDYGEAVQRLKTPESNGKAYASVLREVSEGKIIFDESCKGGEKPKVLQGYATVFASAANTITYSYAPKGRNAMARTLSGVNELNKFVIDPWNLGVTNLIQGQLVKDYGLDFNSTDTACQVIFKSYLESDDVQCCFFNFSWLALDRKSANTSGEKKKEFDIKYAVLKKSRLLYLGNGVKKWLLIKNRDEMNMPILDSIDHFYKIGEIVPRLFALYGLSKYLDLFIKPKKLSFSHFLGLLQKKCPFISSDGGKSFTRLGRHIVEAMSGWQKTYVIELTCSDYDGMKTDVKRIKSSSSVDISEFTMPLDDNPDEIEFLDGSDKEDRKKNDAQNSKIVISNKKQARVRDDLNVFDEQNLLEDESYMRFKVFIESLSESNLGYENWVAFRDTVLKEVGLQNNAALLADYMVVKFARAKTYNFTSDRRVDMLEDEWELFKFEDSDMASIPSSEYFVFLEANKWLLGAYGCSELVRLIMSGDLIKVVINHFEEEELLGVEDDDWVGYISNMAVALEWGNL